MIDVQSVAYGEGVCAYGRGVGFNQCPYTDIVEITHWVAGYTVANAKADADRRKVAR